MTPDRDLEPQPQRQIPLWPLFLVVLAAAIAAMIWPPQRQEPRREPMRATLWTDGTNWSCIVTDNGRTTKASAHTPEAAFADCVDNLD